MIKLAEDQRTSVKRWGSRIKKTGKSGTPNRHIIDLADGTEYHPRKGFRHVKATKKLSPLQMRKEAAIAKEAARYKDGEGSQRASLMKIRG